MNLKDIKNKVQDATDYANTVNVALEKDFQLNLLNDYKLTVFYNNKSKEFVSTVTKGKDRTIATTYDTEIFYGIQNVLSRCSEVTLNHFFDQISYLVEYLYHKRSV